MFVNRVLSKIASHDHVYDLFILDAAARANVELLEASRECKDFTYDNQALLETRGKDLVVCVFSEGFVETPTESLSILVDDEGSVCGQDVPVSMRNNDFGDGALWVSSSYVMYPDIYPCSKLRMVVKPQRFSFLGESEGVTDVCGYNPSLETDAFLKERFGFHKNSTSTIISMNYL